jgi:Cu+-exporting ATPase
VRERGINVPDAADYRRLEGHGARAIVDGQVVRVGGPALFTADPAGLSAFATEAQDLALEGQTPVLVALGDEVIGLLGVADAVDPEICETVASLGRKGIEVVLLADDDRTASGTLARQAGLARVVPGRCSSNRGFPLEDLEGEGRRVGVLGPPQANASALARVEVGFAAGTEDVTNDGAPVWWTGGSLTDVARVIDVARVALGGARRGLLWALGYNLVAVTLATGALTPSTGPGPNFAPLLASIAMSLSALPILTDAGRLVRLAALPGANVRRRSALV